MTDEDEAFDRLRRRVLWSLPTGLYLVGSRSEERLNLMTLNLAMQVSIEPKHVAIAVLKDARTHELIGAGRCFSLSILSREDRAVVRKFVKPAVHDASAQTLNGHSYEVRRTGAPILASAVAFLDLEVAQQVDVGDHSLFIGAVVDAGFFQSEETPVLRMEDTRMNYGG